MFSVLRRIFSNLPLRFPYHKYLGPGNNIESERAIDIDDLIALQHDIEYLEAKKLSDIERADIKAIQEFYLEFITKLNFHALCGWVGLTVKRYLEDKVGILYPRLSTSMVPPKITKPTHRGNKLYADRMRVLSSIYQERKKRGEQITWGDFLKEQRDTQGAGPSGLQHRTSTSSKPSTTSERESVADSPESMYDPPSRDEVIALETGNVMDVDETRGQGSGAHVISGSNTNAQHLRIPRSIKLKTFSLNFGKSRIFYSYGFASKNLIIKKTGANNVDMGDQVYITTSLGMIPNDMLGFYMSPYELGLISNYGLVRVKSCSVTVVPQGIRTAFDTGTTLSGTATSEHCAIGVTNVGINHKYYTCYGGYESTTAEPMIPTGLKDVDLPKIIDKYYGDSEFVEHAPMCLGIPRHIDHYLRCVLNSTRTINNYPKHTNGPPILDKFIDRFNFVPTIGQKVIDWQYSPQFGYIDVKAHEVPYVVNDSDIVYTNNVFSHIPQKIQVTCTKEATTSAKVGVNNDVHSTQQTTQKDVLYYTIDGAKVFAPYDNSGPKTAVHKAVPLIHMGLIPTPALNPATDNTTFQNSCAYWSVKCDIIIEYNLESAFHHKAQSRAHAYNDQIVFIPSREKNNYGYIQPIALESFGA